MSIKQKKQVMKLITVLDCLILLLVFSLMSFDHAETTKFESKKTTSLNKTITVADNEVKTTEFSLGNSKPIEEEPPVTIVVNEPVVIQPDIVYDGLTLEQLGAKLDRSLNSSLAGKGSLIANHSLQLGLDPYLAVAIVLQETGCKWNCSELVKQCNNVGGQKGTGCGNTGYQSYSTLDEGILGFMDNLYNNYYSKGLTTPETINIKYASSPTWSTKINNYITTIKAS
ncbi:MAG: glucosaminidase domain-containing protein [Bacilli bacterium]